jgi:prepilin-type processing-associated H-X9-DG protein
MWLPGNLFYPQNFDDMLGGFAANPNHTDALGGTAGGNVGMVDGHVEWRAVNIIQERVVVYGLYRPYVCY